jgi:magnesium transporter
VLQNVSEEKRKSINHLLQYPEDSTGTIMTTEYVDLREDSTVREAFDSIRRTGVNKETIYICYVIRRDRLLVGTVSAKTLMLSRPQDRIGDIMDKNFIVAHTTDDQEETAALFTKYGLVSLPVVDKEERLVGIVTVDDIVQIIEDETTEDFEVMSGITPSEEPYLKTGIFALARNRIVWLLLLMLSATITGSLIMGFEESLKIVPILYAFIPMLMDTGGNAGSQSATLIIRGIALGEIKFSDILTVLWREIRVGVLCGLALGIVNFVRVFVMYRNDYGAGMTVTISLTVTLSLIATVIISKSVGCMLPLLAKKVKLDPAIMASPLITTIVDAASLIVFFYIARLLLKI